MEPNWLIVPLAAIIPLFVGAIWYNPKVFGNAWLKATGLTEEQLKRANMLEIYGLTYVFSLMLAVILMPVVIHQLHMFSIFANDPDVKVPGTESHQYFNDFMTQYGDRFRTFKHGAFHGTLIAIFFAMPITGIIALFERKSAKYIFIHTGFWIVSLALMGGVLCQFV